jgi:hypothetical protein
MDNLIVDVFIRPEPILNFDLDSISKIIIMKSVFSLAARRTNVAEGGTEVGTRAGELKTYWTNPLPGRGRYGR